MPDTRIITDGDNARSLEVKLGDKVFYLPFKLIADRWVGFLDISGQVSLIESAADEITRILKERDIVFDTILNPVSKSNALAHAVAVRFGLERTVVARKSSDPVNTIHASYRSVTTNREQVLSLTPDDARYLKGKKVLLMDDVYGGGGTTKALVQLAKDAGAVISGHAVIAVEAGRKLPENLVYLFALPVL